MDHEINELNESNMKIEADMMQLQTQVNLYSDNFHLNNKKDDMFTIAARSTWQTFVFLYPKADLVYGM